MEKKGQPGVCRGEAPTPGTSAKPSAVRARQTKGRDTGAQVSSSSPGQGGGWGPRLPVQVSVPSVTSGHPRLPLWSRPSSRAPVACGSASPTPYIYSGAPHLFARTCRSPPSSLGCTAAGGPGARILAGGHALTAPPLLWVVSEHAGGNRLAFGAPFVWNQSCGRSRFPLL